MAFDPSEPRDDHGRWSRDGGGELPVAPDPRVASVGGDEWNKQTAARLEDEYAKARPALDKIVQNIESPPPVPVNAAALNSGLQKAEDANNWSQFQAAASPEEIKALAGKFGDKGLSDLYHDAHEYMVSGGHEPDPEEEMEEETHVPEEWDELSNSDQETVEEHWKESNYESVFDDEVNNWQESDGPAEAARLVAEDDDWKAETLTDFLAGRVEDGEPHIPYSADDLLNAIKIDFDGDSASGYSLNGLKKGNYLDITFDNDKLKNPDNFDPNQGTLPGIEPNDPPSALTPEMREAITDYFKEQFWEAADKKQSNLEAPDYLSDSAKETLDSIWGEKDDGDKFTYAKKHTDVLSNYDDGSSKSSSSEAEGPLRVPAKFDPLQGEGGANYAATQRFAKYMADARASELIKQRLTEQYAKATLEYDKNNNWWAYRLPGGAPSLTYDTEEHAKEFWSKDSAEIINDKSSINTIHDVDSQLWSGWKGSSTGQEGRVLQVAAAEELGGRLRGQLKDRGAADKGVGAVAIQSDGKVLQKDSDGKWQTASQAIADKLTELNKSMMYQVPGGEPKGLHELVTPEIELLKEKYYESIGEKAKSGTPMLKGEEVTPGGEFVIRNPSGAAQSWAKTEEAAKAWAATQNSDWQAKGWTIKQSEGDKIFTRLPDANVLRNGAASMTLDRGVANNWGGTPVKASSISPEEAKEYANSHFSNIGGWDGVKAAIRAKWEITQYLLDRADVPTVQAYRGISMPHTIAGEEEFSQKIFASTGAADKFYGGAVPVGTIATYSNGGDLYIKGPEAWEKYTPSKMVSGPGNEPTKITQGPTYGRVVLRAEIPRTAVLSVPAYGQNIHGEKEVVVAGTGWHGWDAWSQRAPGFDEIPMAHATNSSYADKPREKDTSNIKAAETEAYHPEIKINFTPEQKEFLKKHHEQQNV